MATTVVIADDHAFSAAGLARVLVETLGFDVVGVAENGIEAIALVKKHRPDCAVIDLAMPKANGLEVLVEIRRWSPGTRTAIITGNPSPAVFAQLVDAGVEGIFLKNSDPESICDGIQAMARGSRVIAPEISRGIKGTARPAVLTPREIEVLHAVARGLSNTQIGDLLGISRKTVDSHRTTLMRKMGAHSTATLLVRAMREGLIDV